MPNYEVQFPEEKNRDIKKKLGYALPLQSVPNATILSSVFSA